MSSIPVSEQEISGGYLNRAAVILIMSAIISTAHAVPLTPADRNSIQQQQLLEQKQRQRDELERSTPLPRPVAPALPPATISTDGLILGLPQLGWKKINETF